jgi:cephalosporin hydroxylase
VIVETGVYDGGSTLLCASLCALRKHRRVISVEREFGPGVREAIRKAAGEIITLIDGDSALPETAGRVAGAIRDAARVCVFLDSDHSAHHVKAELQNFCPLVSPGCYLVAADSICRDLADTPRGEASGERIILVKP